MTLKIVRVLNILIAALLAGVSYGIWVGFNPGELSPAAFIEQHQNMLRSLKVMMVSLVFGATILTFISAYLHRKDKATCLSLLTAAGFFIACILITRFGNNPIDEQVLAWSSETLPANWTQLRDSWWSMHGWRTFTEMAALCLVTWSSVRKGS